MCLKEQSKRHLATIIWRFRTLIKREKFTICKAIAFPISFILMSIMTGKVLKDLPTIQLNAVEDTIVTASTYNEHQANVFGPDATFSTTQSFASCIVKNAWQIGLIKDPSNGHEANAVLERVFDQINDEFVAHYPTTIDGLEPRTFTSQTEATDYIKAKDYHSKNGLCFTLGWHTYVNTDAEKKFTMQIKTNLLMANMTDPDIPQNRFYMQKVNYAGFTAYNATDILQVMALSTKSILENVKGVEDLQDKFSIMYTPMDTGEQKTLGSDALSPIIAMTFEILPVMFGLAMANVREKEESTIELIMKRLGVQASVIVMRDLVASMIYTLVFGLLAGVAYWLSILKGKLGLGVIIVMVILYTLQAGLRQIAISQLAPGKLAFMVTTSFFFIQFSLSPVLIGYAVPNAGLALIGSIISPYLQVVLIVHMGIVQFTQDNNLTFKNLGLEVFPNISVGKILGVGFAMVIFYALVILYLWPYKIETDAENPLPWYYPFSCKFWRGKKDAVEDQADTSYKNKALHKDDNEKALLEPLTRISSVDLNNVILQDAEMQLIRDGQLEVPKLSHEKDNGRLVITSLHKKYDGKGVVNDLSLTIYQNEILVLLGHNGAGKTTTLNMLTGLVKATSGSAIAHNISAALPEIDLFKDYQNIADFIGLCPQIDVLFEKMTVRENLIFYCKLKNVENMDRVIDENLEKFNLTAKQTAFAGQISGGQKRKLQLAIALLGNSKIVLLDEPTSGMDPTARRETWEIIKQAKEDKIIILTTHYMDEAEFLADRVAVVSRGVLKICGTTSFLKRAYGQCFYLEVEPVNEQARDNAGLLQLLNDFNQPFDQESSSPSQIIEENKREDSLFSQQVNNAFKPITKHIDEADREVYKMGHYMAQHFHQIFGEIDADLEKFGIKNYTIKNMTLEQVFLAIGDQEVKDDAAKDKEESKNEVIQLMNEMPALKKPSVFQLFKAMAIGQLQSYNGLGIFFYSLLGVVITILMLLFIFLPSIIKTEDWLNYTSVEDQYRGEVVNVAYNSKYEDDSDNLIAQSIVASQGSLINSQTFDYNVGDSTDYTTYLNTISDHLNAKGGEMATYYIDATQSDAKVWDINAVVFANATSPASVPVFGNLLLQSIAQTVSGDEKLQLEFEYTAYEQSVQMNIEVLTGLGSSVLTFGNQINFYIEMALVFNFLTAVYFNNWFNSLLMRGGTKNTYIISTMLCDFIIFVIFTQGFYIANLIYGVDVTGWQPLTWMFVLTQMMYNTMFNVAMANKYWAYYVRLGALGYQFMLLCLSGFWTGPYLTSENNGPDHVSCWFGAYSPAVQWLIGLYKLMYRYPRYYLENTTNVEYAPPSSNYSVDNFGEYGAGPQLKYLLIQACVYFVLLVLFTSFCKNVPEDEPGVVQPEDDVFAEPEEVKKERQRIDSLIKNRKDMNDDEMSPDVAKEILVVDKLVKRYYTAPPVDSDRTNERKEDRPSLANKEDDNHENPDEQQASVGFNAVKGTSFGVKRGEVFSLLGVNGAGKSSTFNCLVGASRVSGGTVIIDGVNVSDFVGQPEKLHGLIGYCPQVNFFDGQMTVIQSITLISRVSGIPESQLEAYVRSSIARFGLSRFMNTQAESLSGGNKRKLCLCLAMIGRPKIVYIDEASTGVDPYSRRIMWKAIRHEGTNSAVVMTTHAMEEAEAISTKIAIQVQGWFRAFGTLDQVQKDGNVSYYVDFSVDLESITSQFISNKQDTLMREKEPVIHQLRLWEDQVRAFRGNDRPLNYADEFKNYGLLDRFYRRLEAGQTIDLRNVLRELLMQDTMAIIMFEIERKGMASSVKNYDGGYFQIEITKCSMSFGQIYAFMESIASKNMIQEYSCKRSSLEEVFNAHATQSMYLELNKRLDRRRSSGSFQSLQD